MVTRCSNLRGGRQAVDEWDRSAICTPRHTTRHPIRHTIRHTQGTAPSASVL
ncbi:MAG: hypothetical protein HC881_21875 [Leptolyngbyaceae cyanobacterium SL_7_1]|nr:hypothetical protein [Leptolyngbyaceae cyanobacterium SL_7_1]